MINIPRPEMTRELLVQTNDADLLESLWNYVLEFRLSGGNVEQLPRGLWDVYSLCGFGSEVVNGGIEQFIGNRSEAEVAFAIGMLHEIGASRSAGFLEQAAQAFRDFGWPNGPIDLARRKELLNGSQFEPMNRALGDAASLQHDEGLLVRWCREHPQECLHTA